MKAWLALILFVLPLGAAAQDGVMISGDSMMFSVPDYGSVMLAQSTMSSAFKRPNTTSPPGAKATTRSTNTRSLTTPSAHIRYDAAISRQIQREYLDSLARNVGQKGADAFERYFSEHPLHQQFSVAAGPYGLQRDDLVDVVTAYFTVMWMTANQAPVPGRPQVEGLRAQIRQTLYGNGGIPADGAQRQRLAESLMYKLVSMILLREEAQASNNTAALRQLSAAAQHEAGKGFDLKATRLTAQGLQPR